MTPDQIKALRHALGLTQERFAQLLHVSIQTVQMWEQGRARPQQAMRHHLAELAAMKGEVHP